MSEAETDTEIPVADPRFEPLLTERLIIRAPVMSDVDPLSARRSDPDVSHYQDWPIPYPPDRAREIVEAAVTQGGLVDEQAWMATVALPDSDQAIGDLYVRISSGFRAAEVGYSFDAAFWGRGYAAEAFDAMLNHLFNDRGIQRASATLHPENIASAQLLERAGFEWEGQTRLSFWNDDRPEPENSDDGFYGLLRADRKAWVNRATGPVDDVRLVDVAYTNHRQVEKLKTHKSQERLVATVLQSYGDALFPSLDNGHPIVPKMWAIEAGRELAGFVMITDSTEHHPEPYLWRLLVDRRFQRRGIGDRAVDLVEDYCRAKGATSISVSWAPGRGSPEPFYLARGYEPTGVEADGEVEARKQL